MQVILTVCAPFGMLLWPFSGQNCIGADRFGRGMWVAGKTCTLLKSKPEWNAANLFYAMACSNKEREDKG